MASQAGTNGKSRVFLDTSPVTIDDEEFDKWVTDSLDITFSPRPPGSNMSTAGAAGTQQAMDYLALAKILATTIGTNMIMQLPHKLREARPPSPPARDLIRTK